MSTNQLILVVRAARFDDLIAAHSNRWRFLDAPGGPMLIKTITLRGDPVLGNLELDFCDGTGTPFSTVVFAGGNACGKTMLLERIHKIFEWRPEPEVEIEILAALDANNIEQIRRANPSLIHPFELMKVQYRRHFRANRDWRFEFLNSKGTKSTTLDYGLVSSRSGKSLFRSFFTEANVSFNADRISGITSLELDQPQELSARSGSDLAQEITQLLVDVRAADSEDLSQWVQKHPQEPPPDKVVNVRMKRFTDAFDYMFPTKRFREIRRVDKLLEVLFDEFGKTTNINQLSTGEKQIVFRGGFVIKHLSQVQSGLLLVDEPELSLHPEWQSRILGFYRRLIPQTDQSSTQLFVATHSPFIVHGAPLAKVIILEKDNAGVIRVMPEPTYPSPGGNLGIVAFNIDSFLASAKYNLHVLVEGGTDESILNTAWQKLYPDKARFFEMRDAMGVKNINITLNDTQLISKALKQKIVGLMDFDKAYDQWNGIWTKTGKQVVSDPAQCLIKKHATGPGWAMLLPCPAHRVGYASAELGGESILSIEFLFEDKDIPPNFVETRPRPMNASVKVFRDACKLKFTEHVKGLPPASFAAFTPIFDRWREIEQGKL
jgi:energy-coupling factor transporter ATP-binding protein EcfA2